MIESPPSETIPRNLWFDPLRPAGEKQAGAVLLADQIEAYVRRFNLLVDQSGFDRKRLKGASYSMKPGGDDAWSFDEKGQQRKLEIKEDSKGQYYEIPPNEFVYIRLYEELRLPYYIIGRFNLKVTYVYQGLLLGTGPQVDPGFSGQLNIPLHNFTDSPVNIYISETFVSIDFVRTTYFDLSKGEPNDVDEFYALYGRSMCLFPKKKQERESLQSYLGTAKPRSSLGSLVKDLGQMRDKFEKRKWLEIGAIIGIAALVATYWVNTKNLQANYFFHFDRRVESEAGETRKSIAETRRMADSMSVSIQDLSKTIGALRDKVDALNAEYVKVNGRLEQHVQSTEQSRVVTEAALRDMQKQAATLTAAIETITKQGTAAPQARPR